MSVRIPVSVTGAGDYAIYPALIPLKAGITSTDTPVLKMANATTYPAVVKVGGKTYLAALLKDVKKGETRTGSLTFSKQRRSEGVVTLSYIGGESLIKVDGKYFAQYNVIDVPKPFIWPIYAPDQSNITRNFPMYDVEGEDQDHPHHRGLWFGHGSVNGTDFWLEGDKSGKVVQKSSTQDISPTVAVLQNQNDWTTADGKLVCQDERTILFWAMSNPRVMDFFITIKATQGPVVFGDTKEGTMALRTPKWMTVKAGTGHIENSEAYRDKDAWGKRAKWVDYYGASPTGKTIGVAILEYADNFRFPTYWHARDYGLFAANPFGIKDFTGDKTQKGDYTIPKGQSLTLKYRIIVHEGDTQAAGIAQIADQFYAK